MKQGIYWIEPINTHIIVMPDGTGNVSTSGYIERSPILSLVLEHEWTTFGKEEGVGILQDLQRGVERGEAHFLSDL